MTYAYNCGTMTFEECWYTFGRDGIRFVEKDDPEVCDAYDFEADIEAMDGGYWRLAEIRYIKPGVGRKPYRVLEPGPFRDAVETYIKRRFEDSVNDRVACGIPNIVCAQQEAAAEFRSGI